MVGIEKKIVLKGILKRRDLQYSLVAQDGAPHSFKALTDLTIPQMTRNFEQVISRYVLKTDAASVAKNFIVN
jgi:hypothetical protein